MQNLTPHISRRSFLELGAAACLTARKSRAAGWTPPPTLKNPNILVVMVDQMRLPMWLSPSQSAALGQTVLPNIVGRLQNNSYNFDQFFAAATNCTPARAALMTGLYAPQSVIYITSDAASAAVPPLNPAYPTWGEALAALNPVYKDRVWWFGKWHLSSKLDREPLLPYGFRTNTIPGGSRPYNVDPIGVQNEGTDGGKYTNHVWANDSLIAGDFTGWLKTQSHQKSAPWCATVSFVNPHDITFAPAWLQSNPFPPKGVPTPPVYFPPPSGSPPSFYTSLPSPWNLENVDQVAHKPLLQQWFLAELTEKLGPVTDWVLFLNQYFWLQNFVDQQVGVVLDALQASPFADNTVVVFLADHGEYAGSHGLHAKGCAVYDEAIHVPLCVQFPGQTSGSPMSQMSSAVDFFGLICDLATSGSGQWQTSYPDLANRQSLWKFLYQNSAETRIAPAPISLPYIFHTYDGTIPNKKAGAKSTKSHIVGLRTTAAKLAFYWEWTQCTVYPNHKPPDPEFYDYTTGNTGETGNDYFSSDATVRKTAEQYKQVLGKWGPPGTGLIASELGAPLVGTGTDGNPLSQAQSAAQQAYYAYAYGSGTCT
jgi:arylsulfatase A-like enzyme